MYVPAAFIRYDVIGERMLGSDDATGNVELQAAAEQARLAALYQLEILDTPPEQPFDDIVAVAAAICDTPIAIINFIDAERQWGKALIGLDSSEAPRAASFCARTIQEANGTLVVPDTLADPRWANNPQVVGDPGLRFYAGAAVVTGDGYSVGSLCVADTSGPRELGPRALAALDALARQTAVLLAMRDQTIKLSAAYKQLRNLAITDPLTSLVNRTFLEHSLWLALRGRERSGRPLGLLFGDLDGLKAINDRLGHHAGDALLRIVAERLSQSGRSADVVSRFGGDEFVVMCPDLAGTTDLEAIAERLGEATTEPVELEGEHLTPHLSIGRAMARDGDDASSLLARADADMYDAKRQRR
jgi:diguanylate cyclase (GGDEF)-like protein